MGSALKKQRKPGCADSAAVSSLRSRRGIQPCIRCRLSRNTQPPWAMHLSSTASAGASWPWPMAMMTSSPFSTVLPSLRAYSSMSLDGE
jgi:hypothetical protein